MTICPAAAICKKKLKFYILLIKFLYNYYLFNIHTKIYTFVDNTIKAVSILPYLFSPVTLKKSRKGGVWRPSRSEVGDSFISHVLVSSKKGPT